ncbi:amidohydrolase [Lysinibacillus macroides]|uniref:Amidohydrolase n=1 Tax=Lysinibacillus macroides TaxID=33935 RepID=A0A0M9DMR5_9BACI|nr:M20 aminoacylase family protein [Lysinibacillus macroides]KOY84069.1 amidohydrolase [Lysinibacillus macroides]QPR66838.1 amidohydrolase [Lysinibacillus macroides]
MSNIEFKKQLLEWRHYLHKYPETAFEEVKTSAYIAQELQKMGLEVHENIGTTGIVANLTMGDGKGVIGLRADMDALNLNEVKDLPYRSKHQGKMHACGHDGHMTTLLGAAQLLSTRRNFNGTVRFIFQPAEEIGKGAQAMIEDQLFERFPVDEIYGLHNMPGLPAGTIHTKSGPIMASEDNFVIRIKGKGAHSSSPHMGVDPFVIAAEIILALQTVVARNLDPLQTAVISCTEIQSDGIRNAIPSNVEIKGDTRSFTPEVQKLLEQRMKSLCEGICAMHGAECEFDYTHEFSPTINWDKCNEVATLAAKNIVGVENTNSDGTPIMASEDFGKFIEKIPGCFVFLGSKVEGEEVIPLHNSMYDYNDEIIEIGAEFFAEIIKLRLAKE